MTRIGVLDLAAGLSGDMFLGALVDAGVPLEAMSAAVRAIGGDRLSLVRREVTRAGIRAAKVDLLIDGEVLLEGGGPVDPPDPRSLDVPHAPPRSWRELDRILAEAPLDVAVRDAARRMARALAEAEAAVHGGAPDAVHFHELGSWDALGDLVGAAAGFRALGVVRLHHGPVHLGGGFTRSEHGTLPVPAPATLKLLEGRPVRLTADLGELTTPTGAAILAVLAEPLPEGFSFSPERTGYGAGRKDPAAFPNVARLTVGAAEDRPGRGRVAVVECSLDDCTPEDAARFIPALLDAGALDATLTPIVMKKGRPGFLLRAVTPPGDAPRLAALVTAITPSLGARWREEERVELERRVDVVAVAGRSVRVKVAVLPGGGERPHVESEDLAALADAEGLPLAQARRLVERAWESTR